ncbi:MAG TPA: hypothetical protein VGO67_18835 [Verrucomicrobiae bacterium]|jgi:hypothetical protein
MKFVYLIPLLVLTACASKKPVVVHMNRSVPGTVIPVEDAESIRYGENLKAYTVGRYVEPDNPLVMHERHMVYRVETTAKWNLHPNLSVGVPMGPATRIVDSAHRDPPVNAEIISEVNRQKEMTETLITEQKRMEDSLKQLSGVIAATQQTAAQNAQLKQESDANTKRLDILEQQLRDQQNTPVSTQTNDTDHW